MLQSFKDKITIQKISFVILMTSMISLVYLFTLYNPIGKVQLLVIAHVLLFVFFGAMIYNVIELYYAHIKKEILTTTQTIYSIYISTMISLSMIVLLTLNIVNWLNVYTFAMWVVVTILTLMYGKSIN
jgi:hypothetical protein